MEFKIFVVTNNKCKDQDQKYTKTKIKKYCTTKDYLKTWNGKTGKIQTEQSDVPFEPNLPHIALGPMVIESNFSFPCIAYCAGRIAAVTHVCHLLLANQLNKMGDPFSLPPFRYNLGKQKIARQVNRSLTFVTHANFEMTFYWYFLTLSNFLMLSIKLGLF